MTYFQLLFSTFILFGHEVKGSFLLHKWVYWIVYLIYLYRQIDRLIKKVTPYIFFYIVIVLTHRAMFYLAKKKIK